MCKVPQSAGRWCAYFLSEFLLLPQCYLASNLLLLRFAQLIIQTKLLLKTVYIAVNIYLGLSYMYKLSIEVASLRLLSIAFSVKLHIEEEKSEDQRN